MQPSATEHPLSEQLLRMAREPSLRREVYEQLGEYCHQCRNRLNSLKLGLYLVRRQSLPSIAERWELIDRHYQDLERRVDQIQSLCRPLTLSRVSLGLDLLIDDRIPTWSRWLSRSGRSIEVARPLERAVVSFDVERLGQSLDELVEWRAGDPSAGSTALIRWWVGAGQVHLVWEESGPAPLASKSSPPTRDGGLWALPLLARIMGAHEGDLTVQTDRGYRVELCWPTLPPSP